MKTYRISPSLLDKWRTTRMGMYRQTSDSFLQSLKVKQPTTPAQSRGSAYHKILEDGAEKYRIKIGQSTYYKVHCPILGFDWVFGEKAVQPAINLNKALNPLPHTFEVKECLEIQMPGYNVAMNMRLDLLVGYILHEFKTSARAPIFQSYEDSLQWKCYMLAFPELVEVKYHFFQLDDDNSQCKYSSFRLPRPATLEDIVKSEINDLITFLGNWPEYLALIEEQQNPQALSGIEGL